LIKRRKIVLSILIIVAIVGLLVNHFYTIHPPSYIKTSWRLSIVYFLIVYKLIELFIFYILFYRRHYLKIIMPKFQIEDLHNFKKNVNRFFFLVPQGSIVFGILSYKLSTDIRYLLLFLLIAAVVVLIVNPNKIKN